MPLKIKYHDICFNPVLIKHLKPNLFTNTLCSRKICFWVFFRKNVLRDIKLWCWKVKILGCIGRHVLLIQINFHNLIVFSIVKKVTHIFFKWDWNCFRCYSFFKTRSPFLRNGRWKRCVWLYVCMLDHNVGTPGPICLQFWIGNSVEPREYF